MLIFLDVFKSEFKAFVSLITHQVRSVPVISRERKRKSNGRKFMYFLRYGGEMKNMLNQNTRIPQLQVAFDLKAALVSCLALNDAL